jgi:hypothetical protein
MRHCWSLEPSNRPIFENLEADFERLIPSEALVAMRADAKEEERRYNVVHNFQNPGYISMLGTVNGAKTA